LREGGLVLDVQPLLASTLYGVVELHVEIIDIGTDADTNATYIVDDVPRVVASEIDVFPQSPMRMDAEETLAESDKDRNV
jgi:uncharacterized protein involved in cysteine biosynthesis